MLQSFCLTLHNEALRLFVTELDELQVNFLARCQYVRCYQYDTNMSHIDLMELNNRPPAWQLGGLMLWVNCPEVCGRLPSSRQSH